MPRTVKPPKRGIGLPTAPQEWLLDAALGDSQSAASGWNRWRGEHDLKNLDSDSRRLLPLVGHNLSQLGMRVPEASAIEGIARLAWARNQLLFKSVGDLVLLFNEHQIDVLFTKGIPLALAHYSSSALRPMNDGDILVRQGQFDVAVELMKSAGWQHSTEQVPSAAHHAVAFKNTSNQEIDVHRFALGECPFAEEDEDFWHGAIPLSVGGASALATNPTDLLFMTCVNSVHSALRWVADAVLLVRGNEIDWQRLLEQARRRKLVFVTLTALSYIEQRYGAPIPASVLEALRTTRVSWLEKREYYAWDSTHSFCIRLLLRYAAYRRVRGAQHPLGLLNHLRLHRI